MSMIDRAMIEERESIYSYVSLPKKSRPFGRDCRTQASTPDPTSHHYHHHPRIITPHIKIRSLFKQQQQQCHEKIFVMAYRHLEKDSFDATITSLCLFCFGSCVVLMCNDFHVHTHNTNSTKIYIAEKRRWPKEFKYYLSIFP